MPAKPIPKTGKVLLALGAFHHNKSPQALPLGLGCLKASILADPGLSSRVDCSILDFWPQESPAQAARRILDLRPALAGFSVFAWNRVAVRTCIDLLLAQNPALPVLLGGPEAFDPELARWPGVAAVFRGEGESALCAWLKGKLSASGQFDCAVPAGTEPAPILGPKTENPQDLASPWLTGALDPRDYQGVLWELARGCPFRCTYCFESRSLPGVRVLDLPRIKAELEFFAKAKVDQVFVLDPTFNANAKRALDILALIPRLCPHPHFHFEIRAEFLDQAQAVAFASGPYSLQIGLQSAHPQVLQAVGRPFKPELFRQKIRLLNQTGAVFGLDLMYGLPKDSLDGFRSSLDWALELEPNHLDLFALSILPGTQLAQDAPGFGLVWEDKAPYQVLHTPEFSSQDMELAAELARACTLFYCRGRAVGWFMRMCRAMEMKPSVFLGGCASWMGHKGIRDAQEIQALAQSRVHELQKEYLAQTCVALGREHLIPVLDDLVGFHAAWAALAVDGKESRIVLNFDPDALNGPEGRKLESWAKTRKPRPRSWKFFMNRGEPVYQAQ